MTTNADQPDSLATTVSDIRQSVEPDDQVRVSAHQHFHRTQRDVGIVSLP